MGKNKGFIPRMQPGRPVGGPPNAGLPPGVTVGPGAQPGSGMPEIPAPPGSSITEMEEVDGLRFHITKMEEQLLEGQMRKIEADEQILKLTRENLELRRQLTVIKSLEMQRKSGIEPRDQVSMRGGKYYKVRPPAAGAPKTPPPDLKLVRDDKGGEMIVPKDAPPVAPEKTPGAAVEGTEAPDKA